MTKWNLLLFWVCHGILVLRNLECWLDRNGRNFAGTKSSHGGMASFWLPYRRRSKKQGFSVAGVGFLRVVRKRPMQLFSANTCRYGFYQPPTSYIHPLVLNSTAYGSRNPLQRWDIRTGSWFFVKADHPVPQCLVGVQKLDQRPSGIPGIIFTTQ